MLETRGEPGYTTTYATLGRNGNTAGDLFYLGGGQDREWYRGIPIPPGAQNHAVTGTCTNLSASGKPLTIGGSAVYVGLRETRQKMTRIAARFLLD